MHRSRRLLFALPLLFLPLLPTPGWAQDASDAASVLNRMLGTWELRPSERVDDSQATIGVRTIEAGLNDLTLAWEENLSVTGVTGRGFIGYDPAADRFYMMGVHAGGDGTVMLLTGTASSDGRVIAWLPVEVGVPEGLVNRHLVASVMELEPDGKILWRATNRQWAFYLVRA